MPQQVYTAFDTGGQTKLTDMDRVAEQRRQEMQDQAFRGALLNNQNNMQREGWGRQDALTQQSLTAQERIAAANNANQLAMGGSFQDRTAANRENTLLQMSPAMQAIQLQKDQWGEGADLRKAKNAGEINRLNFENNIIGQFSGAAGGTGGQPMDPKQLRMAMAWYNKDPSLLKDQFDVDFRDVVKSQVASGALDPVDALAALKSGDLSVMPRKQASSVTADQQLQALDSSIDKFGSKDAATFGSDPGEEDVMRIIAERDKAAQAIRAQNPRISPEQAIQDANFRIEQRLKPYADRWGTEWVARLREVMNGGKVGLSQQELASQNLADTLGRTTEQGAMVSAGNKWLTR